LNNKLVIVLLQCKSTENSIHYPELIPISDLLETNKKCNQIFEDERKLIQVRSIYNVIHSFTVHKGSLLYKYWSKGHSSLSSSEDRVHFTNIDQNDIHQCHLQKIEPTSQILIKMAFISVIFRRSSPLHKHWSKWHSLIKMAIISAIFRRSSPLHKYWSKWHSSVSSL